MRREMILLLILAARLGYPLVDGSPPGAIAATAPGMTLLDIYFSGNGPALVVSAGLCLRR